MKIEGILVLATRTSGEEENHWRHQEAGNQTIVSSSECNSHTAHFTTVDPIEVIDNSAFLQQDASYKGASGAVSTTGNP